MTWPTVFGNLLGGNQPLSLIDGMFQQTAQMLEVPCSASGATAISLTPLVNCPVLTGYTEFCAARFRAAANSAAGVTAQVNGLGFLPVYRADGVTQCGLNDLVLGFEYVVRFSQALGGGVGGWFLEAPAFGSAGGGGTGAGIWTPGGRLTIVAGVPVALGTVSAGTNSQTLYYAPYAHPFVPVFNGSAVAMYQFTSGQADTIGLSLAMAGSGTWPANTMHDLFVTLSGGVPVLGSVQWTSVSARATNLVIFGGFLTNATLFTMRLSGGISSISVPANQGTYVGTFYVGPTPGESVWRFGGAVSGGFAGIFYLYNYYNQVQFNTMVTDTGASYTYTSATVRQARAGIGNGIYFVQGTSEKPASFQYNAVMQNAAAVNASPYFSLGTASTFLVQGVSIGNNSAASPLIIAGTANLSFTATGMMQCLALEASDGVNANTFNRNSNNTLAGQIWL